MQPRPRVREKNTPYFLGSFRPENVKSREQKIMRTNNKIKNKINVKLKR